MSPSQNWEKGSAQTRPISMKQPALVNLPEMTPSKPENPEKKISRIDVSNYQLLYPPITTCSLLRKTPHATIQQAECASWRLYQF
jgi:hypothetical protein